MPARFVQSGQNATFCTLQSQLRGLPRLKIESSWECSGALVSVLKLWSYPVVHIKNKAWSYPYYLEHNGTGQCRVQFVFVQSIHFPWYIIIFGFRHLCTPVHCRGGSLWICLRGKRKALGNVWSDYSYSSGGFVRDSVFADPWNPLFAWAMVSLPKSSYIVSGGDVNCFLCIDSECLDSCHYHYQYQYITVSALSCRAFHFYVRLWLQFDNEVTYRIVSSPCICSPCEGQEFALFLDFVRSQQEVLIPYVLAADPVKLGCLCVELQIFPVMSCLHL